MNVEMTDQVEATVGHNPRYDRYVHRYEDERGRTWFAVGRWDQERGQYWAPLDASTARLTGCSAQFARKPFGMDHYSTRRAAYDRARYLFQPEQIPE